jgi:hypothetical protein
MAGLTVTLDVSHLVETLANMEEQLKSFPQDIGIELTDWQTEDMRRKYPNTTVDETSASTEIWPTSRLVERDDKKIKATFVKQRAAVRKPTVSLKGNTNRPILRPELYDKLVKRMDQLMSEKLAWH